jgi:SAM-dependent methyltransferase
MTDPSSMVVTPDPDAASAWVRRWTHLLAPRASVLDIACGQGRHMKWFAQHGHVVTGVDRSAPAIAVAGRFGETVLADIENDPWPLIEDGQMRQFGAVIVTNYLWRPLFLTIAQSLAPGGVLLYETFAQGNETVGRPSNPDFLLRPAELLEAFGALCLIAFEEGFLEHPARYVQRIAAVQPDAGSAGAQAPGRHALAPLHSR